MVIKKTMKYSPKQYAQALFDALADTDPRHTDLVLDNFMKVLADNNDIRLFEQISEEFHKLDLQKKGIKQAEVVTARPISKQNEAEIIAELNKIAKGNYELKKEVDESVIGGIVIRMEDQMIDASIKNNLEELKKELTE